MIFNIICFVAFLLLIYSVKKTLQSGVYISIQLILSACFVLFFLVTPIVTSTPLTDDDDFNLLLLVGLLGIFIASRFVPFNVLNNSKPKYKIKKKWVKIGFIVYLMYLLIEIYQKISKGSFNFSEIISSNRLEDYSGVSSSSFYYAILFFKIFYYIYIYGLFIKKKHKLFILLYLIPILRYFLVAVTRFDILVLILILIFLYIEPKLMLRNKLNNHTKISTLKITLIMIPILLVVSSYMYFSNLIRHGVLLDGSKESVVLSSIISKNTNDLQYYYFLNDLYKGVNNETLDFEYGVSWVYYPLITYIPRSIWKSKPPTAFSTRYTEKVYWKLGDGPVVTFTIFGEGFIQFGLLGIFLAPILFAYSRYLSIQYLGQIENSKLVILLILFSMVTFFRAEQPIVYVIYDLVSAFFIIKFISKKN